MHDSEYDNLVARNFKPYSEWHRAIYDGAFELYHHNESPITMLDAGCGIGYGYESMVEHGVMGVYVGVDPDKQSIDYCKQKFINNLRRRPMPADDIHRSVFTTTFNCGDFMSFEERYEFDIAFCVEVIEHVDEKDRSAFLKKVAQSAKVAFISTPDVTKNAHGVYTPSRMIDLLRTGLELNAVAIPRDNTILYVASKG